MKKFIPIISYCVIFLLIILDAKAALQACTQAVEICLQTVIPSLFPFLILCPLLTSRMIGGSFPGSKLICRTFGIPLGSESLLLLGLLGGYPVGAQAVDQAYTRNILTKTEGQRMLAFCNNAGPAFILGMGACLVDVPYIPLIVWAIQCVSAISVAALLPQKSRRQTSVNSSNALTLSNAMHQALRGMLSICGWVIAFKILIAILQRWVLWLIPQTAQTAMIGLLELSNGCIMLGGVDNAALRFILFNGFLSFGGLCVWMQTGNVSSHLSSSSWFMIGKCMQLCSSVFLSWIVQHFLFGTDSLSSPIYAILPLIALAGILLFLKKSIAFRNTMVYNKSKSDCRGGICYFAKR